MEAKFRQGTRDGNGLAPLELNPNPLADDLGQLEKAGRLSAEQCEQFPGGKRPIRVPAVEIDLPFGCSAAWFGTVLEL